MSCFCDYDLPIFYRKSTYVAASVHRCEECGKAIQSGDAYEYVAAKWEDGLDVLKTCPMCLDLRQWVHNNVPCFCWAHGNMLDDARECIEDAWFRAPEETVGLRFGFARRLYAVKSQDRTGYLEARRNG